MAKIKICQTCGSVLVKSAKICPNCGAKQKTTPVWLIVLTVILVIGILGYTPGGKSRPSVSSKPSHASQSQPELAQAESDMEQDSSSDNVVEEESKPESEELYKVTYETCELFEDSAGNVSCNVIIEIENTSNFNLYLGNPTYDFEDQSGKLLGTCDSFAFGSSDPCQIAPGEKGYFYSNGATVEGDISLGSDYVFVPHLEVKKSIYKEIVQYDLSDISISEGRFGPCSFIGRITNNTEDDASLVWVCFVLYDSDKNPLGLFGTNVLELNAGETKSFSADALPIKGVSYADISDYEIYAQKFVIQ